MVEVVDLETENGAPQPVQGSCNFDAAIVEIETKTNDLANGMCHKRKFTKLRV